MALLADTYCVLYFADAADRWAASVTLSGR